MLTYSMIHAFTFHISAFQGKSGNRCVMVSWAENRFSWSSLVMLGQVVSVCATFQNTRDTENQQD